MPIVSYTTISGGIADADRALLRRYYGLERSLASRKRTAFSRVELKNLPSLSYLPAIGTAWALLSDEIKASWQSAAEVVGMFGYNLFCQDKAYRIKNEIAGNADPSVFHQYLTGHLYIPESAGDTLFKQAGNGFTGFPATLYISRKTELTADPVDGEFLKVRFKYTYDEGGGETTQTDEISLALASDWAAETLPITVHTGLTGNWELEIETHAVKGDFYFDNFYILGPVDILTKDPHCEAIEKKWLLMLSPAGVMLETYYPA